MHAVILPATPLLVPGLTPGPGADPLTAVRRAVAAALAGLTAGGRVPLVLAHGRVLRWGRMRPSLAGSGIGDRWLPDLSTAQPDLSTASGPGGAVPAAGTGASVALLALADVPGVRIADITTLEVPPDRAALLGGAVDLVRRADGLVVAGTGAPGGLDSDSAALTPGIKAALDAAGAGAWAADVQVFEQSHDQLPAEYRVTVFS